MINNALLSMAIMMGLGAAAAVPVGAVNVFDGCTGSTSEVCKETNPDSVNSPIRTVISVLLFAVGVVSVIMIIVGGLRYVISNGDAGRIKSAKDTILYSVVGLVVALLAFAIVNFVVERF
jgi:hypothetical protein